MSKTSNKFGGQEDNSVEEETFRNKRARKSTKYKTFH